MTRRRYLVTGASRGIGRATALRLAREADVVALVRSGRDAESLEAQGDGAIVSLRADLGDRSARACLVSDAERAFGPIDGLVHAAGLGEHRPIEAVDYAQIDRLFEVNVFAAIDLVRALVVALRARRAREGAVVLIGSTLAERPASTTSVYAATKGAIAALTKNLALELAPERIRVNAVAPGVIDTDMVRTLRLRPGEAMPEGEARVLRERAQMDELARLHPLGRVGTADEVAEAIAFLLDAEFATGTVLTLDGGLSVR